MVFSARGFAGVKVATRPVESRATVPITAVAPAANLKVPVVIVAGFMALLKVAVTTAPWQTAVAAPAGTTETTVGGVTEEVGPPVLLSGSPHPTNATASKNDGIQILPTVNLCISFSSSPSSKRSSVPATAPE